jgi:hypothetical protein
MTTEERAEEGSAPGLDALGLPGPIWVNAMCLSRLTVVCRDSTPVLALKAPIPFCNYTSLQAILKKAYIEEFAVADDNSMKN